MDCNALQWCSKLEIKTQISEDDDEKARCSFGNGELVTFYGQWCFGDSGGQGVLVIEVQRIARIHYPRHKSLQETLNAVQCRKTILGLARSSLGEICN